MGKFSCAGEFPAAEIERTFMELPNELMLAVDGSSSVVTDNSFTAQLERELPDELLFPDDGSSSVVTDDFSAVQLDRELPDELMLPVDGSSPVVTDKSFTAQLERELPDELLFDDFPAAEQERELPDELRFPVDESSSVVLPDENFLNNLMHFNDGQSSNTSNGLNKEQPKTSIGPMDSIGPSSAIGSHSNSHSLSNLCHQIKPQKFLNSGHQMRQRGMSQNMSNTSENLQPCNIVAEQLNMVSNMSSMDIPGVSGLYSRPHYSLPSMSNTITSLHGRMPPGLQGPQQGNFTSLAPGSKYDGMPYGPMPVMNPQNIVSMRGSLPQQNRMGLRHPSMHQQGPLAPRHPVGTVA